MQAADLTSAAPAEARPRDPRPAVSVIVPCYNGARFLDGLMASLDAQTFRDFEIVIVDDGSNDDVTPRKLASLKDRARVIRQDNRGLSATRNAGIRAARADLVLPIDCDDRIEPPFLAEAVALMRSAPAEVAIVFSHVRLTGEANGLVGRHFNHFDVLFANTLPSGMLLRKSCWETVDGYDEAMREGYEDWEFNLRLASRGYRGIEIPKPYYVYAVSHDGMLLGRSSLIHGRLWRTIRRKHAELYRPAAMLRRWRATRDGNGQVSLGRAATAYLLAMLLPDAWYSRVVGTLRRRRRRVVSQSFVPSKSEFAA
jgi:hypothetical protein